MRRRLPFSIALRSAYLMLAGLVWFGLTFANLPLSVAQAAASDLDPTFGNGGKVSTDFFGFHDEMTALVIQPNGKILAAGLTYVEDNASLPVMARYNADGSLDASFGQAGKRTDMPILNIAAMALQSDGKIILGGGDFSGLRGYDFKLVRLNADGSLDTSFADQGIARTDFFGRDDKIQALVIQPDGKIVAAGFANTSAAPFMRGNDFALARYTANGVLDSGFGVEGKATLDLWGDRDEINAIALQRDGKLVAAGFAGVPDATFFGVTRFNSNGTLDQGFGMNGKVITAVSTDESEIYSLAIQPDDKIVAAGKAYIFPTSTDFAVVRYNADGSLDQSFGQGGMVTTDLGSPFEKSDVARAMLLVAGGRILTAGYTFNEGFKFALVRYTSNGNLDPEFGAGGKLIIDSTGHTNQAKVMAMQKDGKIVVGGDVSQGQDFHATDFGMLRLIGDPLPFDSCIQDESNGNLLQINTTTGEYQFTNCAGLTVGGTGLLTRRGSLITLQHNAADRRVSVSLDTATSRASATVQLFSQGRSFTITDKNTANNTCACR